MAKLTESQLIVLSTAAARKDGLAVVPVKMNKAGAAKVGSSLVARKLMREVKAKLGAPVWRKNEGRAIGLIITKAGRDAIGIEKAEVAREAPVAAKIARSKGSPQGRDVARRAVDPVAIQHPRAGSKQALVVSMLGRKSGVTLNALIQATGWLPHTTRAALTGLRKKGFAIERVREGEDSVYRIVGKTAPAAA